MHRILIRTSVILVLSAAACAVAAAEGAGYRPPVPILETYVEEPRPPGFGVQYTDVDGPVYTNASGMTLYTWPLNGQRNGDAGEHKGTPVCDNTKQTVTTGLMSPYPDGLVLPDLDTRPTCIEIWPPVYADDAAKPTGKFTILKRKDGRSQWAYNDNALYTSVLDKKPGQVNGGRKRRSGSDAAAGRKPAGPPPVHPPNFEVVTVATGRLVTDQSEWSVYAWDGDAPGKANCKASCLKDFERVEAGALTLTKGEWGIIEPESGVRQWTFRGKPLYRYKLDSHTGSLEGSDQAGWHNVYTQVSVAPPAGNFTVQDGRIGQVLADARGMSVYIYNCGDDALDQQACDHPTTTQAYRLAICGNGDPAVCNKTWPYVLASEDAKSDSLIWATAWIDPKTGRFAASNDPGALHIWTFRDRPIYHFVGDQKAGDTRGEQWGEFMGNRNGFRAFWLRDDFYEHAE